MCHLEQPMYPLIKSARKTGAESFMNRGEPLLFSVQNFWQWGASNLIDNVWRGVLAEYIVATDLGCDTGVRVEWDAYDLTTGAGVRVEVKSSAYIQSWAQSKLSSIIFGIAPTCLDSSVASEQTEKKRHADVYVFCVLAHKDQETLNPLNMDQWDFYVLATRVLNRKVGAQKTIALSRLKSLDPIACRYGELTEAVAAAMQR